MVKGVLTFRSKDTLFTSRGKDSKEGGEMSVHQPSGVYVETIS